MFNRKDKCKRCFKFTSNNSCLREGRLYLSKHGCNDCEVDKLIVDNTYSKAFNVYTYNKDNELLNYYDRKGLDIEL